MKHKRFPKTILCLLAVLTILAAGCAGNTGDDSLRKVIDAGRSTVSGTVCR